MSDSTDNIFDWKLSDRALREVRRYWPRLDTIGLEVATRDFRIQMSIREEKGDAKWVDEMSRLTKTSEAFLMELENAQWTVISLGQIKLGSRKIWLHELATKVLRVFVKRAGAYLAGDQESDRRKNNGPRANFILAISQHLQSAGYGISARANDDLVRILDLLFDEAGHSVSDPRKTVAHVLSSAGND